MQAEFSLKRFSNDLFFLSLLFVAITFPFDTAARNGAIGGLILAWILGLNKDNFKLGRFLSIHFWLFFGFYVLYLIGLLYTDDLNIGWHRMESKLVMAIFPVVLGLGPKINQAKYRTILKGFLSACTTALIVAVCYAFYRMWYLQDIEYASKNWNRFGIVDYMLTNPNASVNWNYFSYREFSEVLYLHPAYFTLYLSFAVFVLLSFVESRWIDWSWIKKLGTVVLLLFFTFFIVQLSIRGGIIAFLASLYVYLAYLCLAKKRYKTLIIGFIVSTLFVVGVVNYSPIIRYRILQETLEKDMTVQQDEQIIDAVNMRLVNWNCSLEVIRENLLFGVGTGDARVHLNQCYQQYEIGQNNPYSNSHNEFLQVGVNLGLMGLLFFLAALIYPLLSAFSRGHHLYMVYILLFSLSCLSVSFLNHQKGAIFYAFFTSLLVFGYYPSTKQVSPVSE